MRRGEERRGRTKGGGCPTQVGLGQLKLDWNILLEMLVVVVAHAAAVVAVVVILFLPVPMPPAPPSCGPCSISWQTP